MKTLMTASFVLLASVMIVLPSRVSNPVAAQDAVPDDAVHAVDGGGAGVGLFQFAGRLTYLRVHDVGTGFGPASDHLDVEVVFKIDTYPNRAFGFQLRDNGQRVARQGMLDVLRDAFIHDFRVGTDALVDLETQNNAQSIRVWMTK